MWEIRRKTMHCTCWSHCKLVTSTEYLAVIKSLHSPPSLFLLLTLYMLWWGEEGVRREWGRLCLCVRGRGVSGGGKGSCLFEDSARSPRLVSPAWFFEAIRWPHRATSPQVEMGVGGWLRRRVVLVLVVGYGILSFVYSCFFHLVQLPSPPPPPTPLFLSPSSSIPLLLGPFSETPSSYLKELCAAVYPGLPPG